jgi:hypothetical protein
VKSLSHKKNTPIINSSSNAAIGELLVASGKIHRKKWQKTGNILVNSQPVIGRMLYNRRCC